MTRPDATCSMETQERNDHVTHNAADDPRIGAVEEPADEDGWVDEPVFAEPTATSNGRRPWYRPRWRPLLLWLHRWATFVSMVLIVGFFTSGVFMLYSHDLVRWTNGSWYRSTASADPVTTEQAVATVKALDPQQFVFAAFLGEGVYQVLQLDDAGSVTVNFVDPGTGMVNASVPQESLDRPFGDIGSFITNLHNCALSCEGLAGYLPVMTSEVPLIGWSLGQLTIVAAGLATLFLTLTGLVLWWPGLRRWQRGFRLRRRSFYVFNFDLHNVLGFAAIPFLLMWGLTGITFELPGTSDLWYSATGGRDESMAQAMVAATTFGDPSSKPEISLEEAKRLALAAAPGSTFTGVFLPDPEGMTTGRPGYYYAFALARAGLDPQRYGGRFSWQPFQVTGSELIYVGAYDGRTVGPTSGLAAQIWDDYRPGLHVGTFADPFWRLIWAFFGLSAVVLTFTGMVMWWRRWNSRRHQKRRAARTATTEAGS